MRYKVDISYDGTDFIGWQIQPNGRSIQGVLEDALSIVLRSKTRILGASRTDSGVHADQQIASFTTTATIDLRALKTSLNALLPGSIRVNEVVEVEDAFHPIASAVQKVYCYRIWNERKPPPKDRLYVWALGQDLDVDNMAQAMLGLVGRHDFRVFMASDSSVKTTIREIFDVRLVHQGAEIALWFSGNGFLKQMIRSITGTLVEIGSGKKLSTQVTELLAIGKRSDVGATAPALGLSLSKVNYRKITPLSEIIG